MKIYAINGSPRKKWNSGQLLEKFIEGIHSVEPEAEVKIIHAYDYNYTGCTSCFGCKLVSGKPLECVVKDDIHDILKNIRNSDGLVVASPIYFFDLSAQVKALLERLMYPGVALKPLPSTFIYTMNANEEQYRKLMKHQTDVMKMFMTGNFKSEPEEVFSFDTLQRNNNELYRKGHSDMEAKARRRKKQFPKDCENAFHAGVRLVERIKRNS